MGESDGKERRESVWCDLGGEGEKGLDGEERMFWLDRRNDGRKRPDNPKDKAGMPGLRRFSGLYPSKQTGDGRKREKNELRKQNLIAQIIDISHMISNEVGSCLLDFLNRIYDSPLGMVLFKNLLLFCEIPKEVPSYSLNFPISLSTLEWIGGEGGERGIGPRISRERVNGGLDIRIVVIQRPFPNNRKANMGLIAYEVTRQFSSDPKGIKQILQTLEPSDINQFKKMDGEKRIHWLMGRWGFQEELEALKREMAALNHQAPSTNIQVPISK